MPVPYAGPVVRIAVEGAEWVSAGQAEQR